MQCVICNLQIEEEEYGWRHGHNASPVKEGRCCSQCNYAVVLPMRMRLIKNDNRQTERRDRT